MVERKKIAGIGEDTGAGAWGIGEEGRGQGSQMVERKKIAGIGGKTGAAQRGGLGKRGGGGGEPVVILFKSPFRYTSSWYTLWLVSFRRMPIKWNGDMFQLWARRVVIQKRMSASYIDVYERDGKLITAFPAHQLPQQEQKDTSAQFMSILLLASKDQVWHLRSTGISAVAIEVIKEVHDIKNIDLCFKKWRLQNCLRKSRELAVIDERT